MQASSAIVLTACISVASANEQKTDTVESDVSLLYQYANEFLTTNNVDKAVAVYGMIIGTYSGAGNTEKIRETCDAMDEALPRNILTESNLLYWICPRQMPGGDSEEKVFPKLEAKLLSFVQQPYSSARNSEGVVNLAFYVSAGGKAQGITVVSSTDEKFEKTAVSMLRSARFTPAIENGSQVDSKISNIVIRFQTEDGS